MGVDSLKMMTASIDSRAHRTRALSASPTMGLFFPLIVLIEESEFKPNLK